MLHGDVLMADLDVDQWRNAQQLLLRSAKGQNRVVCLLDDGEVQKCRNSSGAPVEGVVTKVDSLVDAAKNLYEANASEVDFALVAERKAFDQYFFEVQSSWTADEDLDDYVQRSFTLLRDSFADSIVTYPEPAWRTLGLQWRTGLSKNGAETLVKAVRPGSTVVFAVTDANALWTSLILKFDEDRKIISIGTADPSLVDINGSDEEILVRLTRFAEEREGNVSFAMLMSKETAEKAVNSDGGWEAISEDELLVKSIG